jgi:hypothetical protein
MNGPAITCSQLIDHYRVAATQLFGLLRDWSVELRAGAAYAVGNGGEVFESDSIKEEQACVV